MLLLIKIVLCWFALIMIISGLGQVATWTKDAFIISSSLFIVLYMFLAE